METMTQKFTEIYPNCKVEYEYLQDYQETLFKRLDVQNNSVDMFVTDNIQKTSANYPYALELFSHSDKLDLSNTSQELLDNYKLTDSDTDEIYAVAMGIEVRGLYVNKTLLDSLGLKIPENREEFLDSCRVLSEHGYIPLQSNPGSFGQQLIFPYVAHIVAAANDEGVTYNTINNCEEGAAEIFRDPLEFLYGLVDKNYLNDSTSGEEITFQLIGKNYRGVVASQVEGDAFPQVTYQNKNYAVMKEIFDAASSEDKSISFSEEFTNQYTRVRSFARYIYLTLENEAEMVSADDVPQAREHKKVDLAGKNILLCEDYALNAESIVRILEKVGMSVDVAENGQVGVKKYAAVTERYYDAILMDVRMPVMNGMEATQAIRAMEKRDAKTIPIIALTANAYESDIQSCLEAGMNAHLAKPVDKQKLYDTLAEMIKEDD